MSIYSGNGEARAAESGQDRNSSLPLGDGYVLPLIVRILSCFAAVYVAYSQFVAVGFLFLYRYYDIYDYMGMGRDEPEGFVGGNILVLSLFNSGGTVAVNDDYPIWFTMLLAAVLTPFGCAGLLLASCAKVRWRFVRTLLLVSFAIGIVAMLVILHIQIFDGAIRKRWMNLFNIDNAYVFFPIHGVV